LLDVRGLSVAYGDVRVLYDVTLRVGEREIVSLVGANGAGKTTTLRAVSGLLPVLHGEATFEGERLTGLPPSRVVERGIAHVPEGRQLFTNMTVGENLEMGAYLPRAKAAMAQTLDWVTGLFPRLAERRAQLAAPSPAASSRCSPSAAPSCPARACSSSTSRRWAWPRSW